MPNCCLFQQRNEIIKKKEIIKRKGIHIYVTELFGLDGQQCLCRLRCVYININIKKKGKGKGWRVVLRVGRGVADDARPRRPSPSQWRKQKGSINGLPWTSACLDVLFPFFFFPSPFSFQRGHLHTQTSLSIRKAYTLETTIPFVIIRRRRK